MDVGFSSVDDLGVVIHREPMERPGTQRIFGLMDHPQYGFIAVGDEDGKPYVARLDASNGTLVTATRLSEANRTLRDAIAGDGGAMVIGSRAAGNERRPILGQLDASAENAVFWDIELDANLEPHTVVSAPPNLVFSATRTEGQKSSAAVCRIANSGSVVWCVDVAPDVETTVATSVVRAASGNLVVGATAVDDQASRLIIREVSPDGTLGWTIDYPLGTGELRGLRRNADGELFAVGATVALGPETAEMLEGWLMGFSQDGEALWNRRFPASRLDSVVGRPDRLIVAGLRHSTDTTGQAFDEVWTFETDTVGNTHCDPGGSCTSDDCEVLDRECLKGTCTADGLCAALTDPCQPCE